MQMCVSILALQICAVHAIQLSRRLFRLGLERPLRSTEFRISLTQSLVPHCQTFPEISQLGKSDRVKERTKNGQCTRVHRLVQNTLTRHYPLTSY